MSYPSLAMIAGPVSFFQPQPILTLERAREESKLCMMGAVREVMAKTGRVYHMFLLEMAAPAASGASKKKQ